MNTIVEPSERHTVLANKTRQEEIIDAGIELTMSTRPVCLGGGAHTETVRLFNRNPNFELGAQWADLHPVKKDYTFNPILRILDAIPTGIWKAKSKQCEIYAEKLAKNLESEGYLTDAALIREKIKMKNGEPVAMAVMDNN
jgi:hypothetical protein